MTANRGAHILVVDDPGGSLFALGAGLEQEGYRVTSVDGGAAAMAAVEAGTDTENGGSDNPVDLVLLNLTRSAGDGIRVLSRLRDHRSPIELPVIIAAPGNSGIAEALQAGANDFVTRPLDLPLLIARVQTHIDLAKSKRALNEAEHALTWAAKMESIGYLNSGVAHEIKNTLAKIQIGIDALQRLRGRKDAGQAGEQREAEASIYPVIQGAIDQTDAILHGLMRFSPKLEFALQPGNLGEIVQQAIELIDVQARETGVTVETEFDHSLPHAMVDPLQMRQVVSNLLSNAIEAMPGGGVLSVRTSAATVRDAQSDATMRGAARLQDGDQAVSLVIADTGTGISADLLPKVFDPFFTTKPAGRGAGLGLTIAKKLIGLHGGLILIGDRPGESGTSVTVLLRTVAPPLAGEPGYTRD